MDNLITLFNVLSQSVIGFTDLNINTAPFTSLNVIPEYKSGGTRQWGTNIANNTGFNRRRVEQMLFLNNEFFNIDTAVTLTRVYDTGRNYVNKFVSLQLNYFDLSQTLPVDDSAIVNTSGSSATTPVQRLLNYLQLTTTFQTIISNLALPSGNDTISSVQIRAIDTGGIEIKINMAGGVGNYDVYIVGVIHELRLVSGADV